MMIFLSLFSVEAAASRYCVRRKIEVEDAIGAQVRLQPFFLSLFLFLSRKMELCSSSLAEREGIRGASHVVRRSAAARLMVRQRRPTAGSNRMLAVRLGQREI